MPRRNYKTRQGRRVVQYAVADTSGDYRVTLTNYSGTTTIVVNGSRTKVWDWATIAGANGGIKPGYWVPVSIELIREHTEMFSVVS